jgi:hypothetical protein
MQAGTYARGGRAAGNDIQIRRFLGNDDVVDILGEFILGKIEAGLQRIVNIGPWQRTDVIAMFLVFLRPPGIDILVRRYELPPIFRETIIFLPGRGSGHDLRTVEVGATVDYRVVFLKKAPGAFFAGWVDTGHQEDLSVLWREFGKVVKKGMFLRFLSVYAQIQIACRLRLILFFF